LQPGGLGIGIDVAEALRAFEKRNPVNKMFKSKNGKSSMVTSPEEQAASWELEAIKLPNPSNYVRMQKLIDR
jgi:hypothetical protein